MTPTFGVPVVRRRLTETSGRDGFPSDPAASTVVFVSFDGPETFGSGSRSVISELAWTRWPVCA